MYTHFSFQVSPAVLHIFQGLFALKALVFSSEPLPYLMFLDDASYLCVMRRYQRELTEGSVFVWKTLRLELSLEPSTCLCSVFILLIL